MTHKPDIQRLIEVHKLLIQFQAIQRHNHYPVTHQPENDVEHTYNLTMTAWFVAQYFPRLDRDKVIRYALVHDIVEVHAGDTNIYADPEFLATKKSREAAALKQLEKDWPDFGDLVGTIKDYETHTSDEAKFVYALDKIMPIIMIFLGEGYTWHKDNIPLSRLDAAKRHKIAVSPEIAPFYDQLYALLVEHHHYFPPEKP